MTEIARQPDRPESRVPLLRPPSYLIRFIVAAVIDDQHLAGSVELAHQPAKVLDERGKRLGFVVRRHDNGVTNIRRIIWNSHAVLTEVRNGTASVVSCAG